MIYSTEFIQAVCDGIREYNKAAPSVPMQIINGKAVVMTPQALMDARWFAAVKHGLHKADSLPLEQHLV